MLLKMIELGKLLIVAITAYFSFQAILFCLSKFFKLFKMEVSNFSYRNLASISVVGIALQITIVFLTNQDWLVPLEFYIGLVLSVTIGWLVAGILWKLLERWLLDKAFNQGQQLSGELLLVVRYLLYFGVVLSGILLVAGFHEINIGSILTSLGIGGLAVAFAAQKTLEQLLGGIVIALDRPFLVGDYIGLSDGMNTFGRVESIGLRSTKIRTSGKGTLVIVPNNWLTQTNIENFTGAKKVMSVLQLRFLRELSQEEQALVRQMIVDTTNTILGIDNRSTEVIFKSSLGQGMQAQLSFFILGSGEISMDVRRQLLDVANQKMRINLQSFGIEFTVEEPTIYVDSPITL